MIEIGLVQVTLCGGALLVGGVALGVLLMCIMRMASPDPQPEGELAAGATRAKD